MDFENTIDFTNWAYKTITECKTKKDCLSAYTLVVNEYVTFTKEHIMRQIDKQRLFDFVVATYVMKRSTMADRLERHYE